MLDCLYKGLWLCRSAVSFFYGLRLQLQSMASVKKFFSLLILLLAFVNVVQAVPSTQCTPNFSYLWRHDRLDN